MNDLSRIVLAAAFAGVLCLLLLCKGAMVGGVFLVKFLTAKRTP